MVQINIYIIILSFDHELSMRTSDGFGCLGKSAGPCICIPESQIQAASACF